MNGDQLRVLQEPLNHISYSDESAGSWFAFIYPLKIAAVGNMLLSSSVNA